MSRHLNSFLPMRVSGLLKSFRPRIIAEAMVRFDQRCCFQSRQTACRAICDNRRQRHTRAWRISWYSVRALLLVASWRHVGHYLRLLALYWRRPIQRDGSRGSHPQLRRQIRLGQITKIKWLFHSLTPSDACQPVQERRK